MIVGRRFLGAVGLMWEDYFFYCEEVESCLRGLARGMRLGFASDAHVVQYQGTTTGSLQDIRKRMRILVYLNERNKFFVTRDCFSGAVSRCGACRHPDPVLALCEERRQLGYGMSGRLAGVLDERGAPQRMRN